MKEITKKITTALHVDFKTYDDSRHTYFEVWCALYADMFDIAKRDLITNQSLFNWYLKEWETTVERSFLKECYCEGVETPDLYQMLFFTYPKQVEKFYPKSLLQKLRIESKFKAKHSSK